MIIEDYRTEEANGVVRFGATVRWEDRDREPVDVFICVLDEHAGLAHLSHDAFRLPASVIARFDRETRVTGGPPICPVLHDGIATAHLWLARWAKSASSPPVIELPRGCQHADPFPDGLSGLFVSGGIDSMSSLVANHESFPPGHRWRVSHGIVGIGFQKKRWMDIDDLQKQLTTARKDLAKVGQTTGIEIIPVATNLRDLNPSTWLWQHEYQGSVLAGIGHIFGSRFSNISISSGYRVPDVEGHSYHPSLVSNFGSHSLSFRLLLGHLSRLQKTEVVAGAGQLLDLIHVCNVTNSGEMNCGRCEKCVRTMLALEAIGRLDSTSAFQGRGLETKDLKSIEIDSPETEADYRDLLKPLADVGRADLIEAIRRAIRRERVRSKVTTMKRRIARLRDRAAKVSG